MALTDDLPALDSEYPLTSDAIAAYARDGHVRLDGVVSEAELAPYREAIRRIVAERNRETRPMEERDTYAKAFIQIINLWVNDETVRRYVLARRFGKIACDLMGCRAVRIYHDQALFKEVGGGPTPWHQDQYYWPLSTPNTVTMWMPLVDVTSDMGTMRFASGSQVEGFIGQLKISDESEAFFDRYVAEKGYPLVGCGDMKAGDASFHTGWTLHKAPGNAGAYPREAMTIIYVDADATIAEPDNENRVNDMRGFFPGLGPGDPVASPLNPIVYARS
ncbi:MAG: phytanoyl-CoA dioxygenase family protein [Fimbriimonadaceae bacterium]|nr:phytanoyl-CoA dioxygenase family protein [Fimbriimonadaceae bacterium]